MRAYSLPFEPFPDYALLDSGAGEKLERFGSVILRRPDPQALWKRARDAREWERAELRFVRESDRGGRWEPAPHASSEARRGEWLVRFDDGCFAIKPTPFKHVGIFPEQSSNWRLVRDLRPRFARERPRLLNLFGYTGVASVLAAQAGYEVTHLDASKLSIVWTRRNAELSGLRDDALRVLVDDALTFARREVRRRARYDVVLLDPPHFGRGPRGETWQFEDHVAELIDALKELLEPRALVILSTYAIGCSPLSLQNLLADLGEGELHSGELALPCEGGGRALPAGFCARWSRDLALERASA